MPSFRSLFKRGPKKVEPVDDVSNERGVLRNASESLSQQNHVQYFPSQQHQVVQQNENHLPHQHQPSAHPNPRYQNAEDTLEAFRCSFLQAQQATPPVPQFQHAQSPDNHLVEQIQPSSTLSQDQQHQNVPQTDGYHHPPQQIEPPATIATQTGLINTKGWCSACSNIPFSLFSANDDMPYLLKPNLASLVQSADGGCRFCETLITYLPKGTEYSRRFSAYHPTGFYKPRADGLYAVAIKVAQLDESAEGILRVCPKGESGVDINTIGLEIWYAKDWRNGPGGWVTPENNSDVAFSFGKDLIQRCKNEHIVCQASQTDVLPTRLVDVGVDDDSMRIVETHGASGRGVPYLCLSYCWGKQLSANLILTKTTNLEARYSKLEIADLSKTLLDSMSATRGLGYRYIWIDALCICQDSVDDWRDVSSHMGDIYANAAYTIAASAAHENPNVEIVVRNAELDPAAEGPANGPLYKRGWCYQETTLSPRVLHYTEGELVFECERFRGVTESAWEFNRIKSTKETQGVNRREFENLDGIVEGVEEIWYKHWIRMVGDYTKRSLTKEEDRLLAISAIARNLIMPKVLAENPGDAYFAGSIRGDFQHWLAWTESFLDTQPLRRSKPYVAPSWSWASVSGAIEFRIPLDLRVISLIDVGTTLINPRDPFGQVSDGFVKINGSIKKARNSGKSTTLQAPIAEILSSDSSSARNARDALAQLSPPFSISSLEQGSASRFLGEMHFDDPEDGEEEEIYCLHIRDPPKKDDPPNPLTLHPPGGGQMFLALHKVNDRGEGVFRRVGIGAVVEQDWFQDVGRSVLTII